MRRISLSLTAVLLTAAGCETTETPPAPAANTVPATEAAPGYEAPAPGTIVVVRHQDGALETSRVLGASGHVVTMLRDEQRVTLVPFCFRCDSPPDGEAGDYRGLWPLEPGRSASFRSRRDGEVLLHDIAVTGTETVETDFGPVETLVVEETVSAGGQRRATRTEWFSPQLGWSVRSRWEGPGEEPGGWDLAAIALPR